MKEVRSAPRFIFFFLQVDIQLFQYHSLKRPSFLHCFCQLVRNQLTLCGWVHFWALSSVPLVYLSVVSPTLHCPDSCRFVENLSVGWCQSSDFYSLFYGFQRLSSTPVMSRRLTPKGFFLSLTDVPMVR